MDGRAIGCNISGMVLSNEWVLSSDTATGTDFLAIVETVIDCVL